MADNVQTDDQLGALRAEHRQLVLRAVGIDPQSPHAEAVLALAGENATLVQVQEAIAEFGFDGPAVDENGMTPEQQDGIDAAARGRQLDGVSFPVRPPTTMDEKIAAAEARAKETGDWDEFMRLQAQVI